MPCCRLRYAGRLNSGVRPQSEIFVNPEQWSQDIAELAADALIDAKLLGSDDLAKAKEIIAEEIWVRLNLGDFPVQASSQ